MAVIALDFDDFKLVNESLGHEAGDALIVQLAERLRDATRETDLIARPGGDEFLMLLSDLDRTPPVAGGQDGASIVAESVAVRIQQALLAPFEISGTELYLSASMGISVFPNDAEVATALMKNADTAMFQSKKAGPRRIHPPLRRQRRRAHPAVALDPPAEGRGTEELDAALPAGDRSRHRRDVRCRGADPVALTQRRPRVARASSSLWPRRWV